MLFPGLVSLGRLPPRGNRMDTFTLSFATAMGMIHRIHGHAADRGPYTHPAVAASLSNPYIHVIFVAYSTDSSAAFFENHPHLARRKLEGNVIPFLGGDKGAGAGGTDHLAAPAQGEFHIMNRETQGDIFQGKGIPRRYGGAGAGDDFRFYRQALGGDNVPFSPSA